jgi:collagenase-like PrtC family protease
MKNNFKKFCVPWNSDPHILAKYIDRKESIYEIYGSDQVFASQRTYPGQKIDFSKVLRTCSDNGIIFNYTLNSNLTHYEGQTEKIREHFATLLDEGLQYVTLNGFTMRDFLEKCFPGKLKYCASTYMDIDHVSKLKFLKEKFHRVVLPEKLTHDIHRLSQMCMAANENIETELIINNKCFDHCYFRYEHLSLMPKDPKESLLTSYWFSTLPCFTTKLSTFVKRNLIPPKWLDNYKSLGIKYFKLCDRLNATETIIRSLDAYLKTESCTFEDLSSTFRNTRTGRRNIDILDPLFENMFGKNLPDFADNFEKVLKEIEPVLI